MTENFNHSTSDYEKLVDFLLKSGNISASSIRDYELMNKKEMVLNVHKYSISQGQGADKRWFTRVEESTKGGGKKRVAKNTEEEIYDFLYHYYFGNSKPYNKMTLKELYPEWFEFKKTKAVRNNTLHRIDTDYKRYYLDEPLSAPIMSKPLASLKKMDIEKWAYSLIKKYNMTHKAFSNMAIVLRQTLDYLVDMEVIEGNPFLRVKIDNKAFRKVRKKPAQTQIFYEDESKAVVALAYQMAEEKQDEVFLAIPLFFYSGIRIGECLGLSFEDFRRDEHILSIHQSMMVDDTLNEDGTWGVRQYKVFDYLKHNADPREVIVNDVCFDIADKVKAMQEKKGLNSELLFNVKTPSNLQLKMIQICKRLGISSRSPHKIRKTYISTLLNNRVDPDFVRTQVGHQELQTTLNSYTYATSRKETQLEQLNKIFD